MKISDLQANDLRELLELTEKRERLAAELSEVERRIATIYSRKGESEVRNGGLRLNRLRRNGSVRRRAGNKRGAVRAAVMEALRQSGLQGISVTEMARAIGQKPENLHVWFSTTGKKVDSIEKVGPGRYRLRPESGVDETA